MKSIIEKQIAIAASGDVVNFLEKLPPSAVLCEAIYFNPSVANSQKLANVSLTFNSGRGKTINQMVGKNNNDGDRKKRMMKINQPLEPNSFLKGYVEDLQAASLTYPYNVTLYFEIINSK